ncbi:MAG: hypothetical protein B7Z47_02360 [Chthoniobacter sp. 12-60-6]|nr:MAG: hypothetical protein B7Z47_02360 [Chthoniobacter sp. 12-60-6]
MPHARPSLRLLAEVHNDFIGKPLDLMLRRPVEAEVGADVRVSGERIQPLGAREHLLSFIAMNEVLLHRLPHETGGRLCRHLHAKHGRDGSDGWKQTHEASTLVANRKICHLSSLKISLTPF